MSLSPTSYMYIYIHIKGEPALNQHWRHIVTEQAPGIFTFPIFTETFCNMLVAEIDKYEHENQMKCCV